MAATQEVVPAAVLSDDNNATFEEMMAVAREKAALEPKADDQEEAVTRGLIVNRQKNNLTMHLYDQHNWYGNPVPSFPSSIIIQMHPVEFKHKGPLPQGSKGGVVYADQKSFPPRKWLLAFDLLKKKVYVEAGPIGPTDWNVVEVKLDASEDRSTYEDSIFGGKASGSNDGKNVFAMFYN
ncbi:jasmonate-induced protein homolog [Chenopodium quinoa]|uniref:Uncharacterized protein n=1 Tax=Chenopodium quinoa TaxID=63459 RepID=A0A803MTW8_CHEQI|nr:jasmonate-induced protein homolog [Chenopodium quinoa]XP_021725852.1 jasmonate-induced protein homolog [Chenopodium quinoa]